MKNTIEFPSELKIQIDKKKFNLGTFTIVFLTLMAAFILSVTSETFLSYRNIYSILYGVSFQFFAIIGFTYLMIMGEIDLSVGSVYAFSGAFLGLLVFKTEIPFFLAIIISLIVSSSFGLLTGIIVTRYSLNSLMVSIGMMTAVGGLSSVLVRVLEGRIFPGFYRGLVKFRIFDIHWTVILMFLLVILLEFLLFKTAVFRKMYYVGENLQTAKIYGVKAEKVKTIVFTLSSLTAAIGGILAASRITNANIVTGKGLEFTVLTAAVIGGASLFGGRGSILKSTLGLIFIALLTNGLVIYKVDPLLQQSIVGLLLVIAVWIDTQMNR